jgi:ribulose 1,5-bisphosphate synthetase/thiazole synthase
MTEVANLPAPEEEPSPGAKYLSQKVASHVENASLDKPEHAYKIKDQWHSQPQHLRVIHVGAGAAGLLMAYKMKKSFQDYSLVCYEK